MEYDSHSRAKKLVDFRRHSQSRAWERYGFDLTDAIYDEWLAMIHRHECIQIARNDERDMGELIKLILYQGTIYPVYYNDEFDAITSVLPEHSVYNGKVVPRYRKNKMRKGEMIEAKMPRKTRMSQRKYNREFGR